MSGPHHRHIRRVLVLLWLLAVAALPSSPVADRPGPTPARLLQMNLCNSGLAGCYTGRSVTEAARVIRAEAPQLVTLNEVCGGDVDTLERALTEAHPGGTVVAAFQPARNRLTGAPYRCRNGQPYGIGVLAQLPAPHRDHTVHGGIHPPQDAIDPEERAWLCVHADAAFLACTTHLAYTSSTVALAQCHHLLGTVVPAVHRRAGYQPTMVGGDLNLRYGGAPDVRSCVPAGWVRGDDGGVQQFMATADVAVRATRSIGMAGTTDHPSFLTDLTVGAVTDRSI